MIRPMYKWWLACAGVLLGGVLVWLVARTPSPPAVPVRMEALLDGFRAAEAPDDRAYDDLFRYFVEGFETYRSAEGALAAYPGLRSSNGRLRDGLEAFARSAPLWGAWVRSGRSPVVRLQTGAAVDLNSLFRRGLLAGTDPSSREYWGDIADLDQRIVEASDVGLALWLMRDTVWSHLSAGERQRVGSWLNQVNGREVHDNNWHLFSVFVNAVLRSLGVPFDARGQLRHYSRFKRFYRAGGWFSDGPGEQFDYYNAWGIHYQLYWLRQVDPTWDEAFLTTVGEQFLSTYKYLLGPSGFPILGRSVCYRMAAPAPLVLAQIDGSTVVSPGQARRALDSVWRYFIRRGGVRRGAVTQGYCGDDPRVLDNYSGPASCLWALRSLVAAFYLPAGSRFWRDAPEPLPVERVSYRVLIPETGWTAVGNRDTAAVAVEKRGSAGSIPLDEHTLLRRMAAAVLGRPLRPHNLAAKYGASIYSSATPFCGCLP